MDHAWLRTASLEQLQREAVRYRLEVSNDRQRLIEAILDHLTRFGPTDPLEEIRNPPQAEGRASDMEGRPGNGERLAAQPEDTPLTAGVFQQSMQLLIQQQQQFFTELQRMFTRGGAPPVNETAATPEPQENDLLHTRSHTGVWSNSPQAGAVLERRADSVVHGNPVSWLSSQIPEFGGTDQENVLT